VADDQNAIVQLRAALWAAGFTAEGVSAAMGTSGEGFTPRPSQVPVLLRMLAEGTARSTLVKLFLAGVPVPAAEASAALHPLEIDAAVALGLVRVVDRQVSAQVRLAPSGDLLLAFDLIDDVGGDVASDVVVGVSASSRSLADLTVRRPVADALDLGTGSGIQAMLAARHALRVTATDANPRALAFARFNAVLNGLGNIEVVEGDLLSAVAGRSFDLIVSNPPFVVSPDADYLYRDGGRPRDLLSRDLVTGVAGLLREGGYAELLVSWVHQPDGDWSTPVREWVADLGCDAWLLHFTSDDPLDYATSWNHQLEHDVDRYTASINRWLDYFESEAIGAIGYGAVILRRRAGENWTRWQSMAGPPVGPANDQIVGLFGARDFLAGVGDAAELLDQRLVIDDANRLNQSMHCIHGTFQVDSAELVLKRGLAFRAVVDVYSAQLLSRFDGTRTVRQAIDESIGLLADDVDRAGVEHRTVGIVTRMLELGFVHPAPNA
jgi:hypothetical protein